jgi:hypothetical protein
MSFSDELINAVPYRPVLVRAHATRHPIPWCPAQHQLAAISNQDQERGGEATGSSLQASGTPAGRAPAAATQRQPPHPWGPRGEDQPWVDTAGWEKWPTWPVVNYYCCRSTSSHLTSPKTKRRGGGRDEKKRRGEILSSHWIFFTWKGKTRTHASFFGDSVMWQTTLCPLRHAIGGDGCIERSERYGSFGLVRC